MTKVFWLYGRSGAGKTTLAEKLRNGLLDRKLPVFFMDGDDMRAGLCADLQFTSEARVENHRRIAEVAKLAAAQGMNVIVATMAPEHKQRDIVQQVLGSQLCWIYIHAPLDVCVSRDPKGLYGKAKAGRLKNLLDYPFEVPRPHERENYINTVAVNVEGCYRAILELAQSHLSEFAI